MSDGGYALSGVTMAVCKLPAGMLNASSPHCDPCMTKLCLTYLAGSPKLPHF